MHKHLPTLVEWWTTRRLPRESVFETLCLQVLNSDRLSPRACLVRARTSPHGKKNLKFMYGFSNVSFTTTKYIKSLSLLILPCLQSLGQLLIESLWLDFLCVCNRFLLLQKQAQVFTRTVDFHTCFPAFRGIQVCHIASKHLKNKSYSMLIPQQNLSQEGKSRNLKYFQIRGQN